ncbi:hypothetical protein KL921_004282 [Ogataea angusta]|uniref:non-specific serine/threonine protein kinase n=1 Tax=Pichia angusta TaxID=870730 RepID=A0ABQ7RT72_PICAN|nr:hypothetical protein KL921_004282 [Ogataea angusta]KAG7837781.1 hypothetical protein KL942_004193 [Ogataea angusta]KAG7847231.1 hypothetical protein KL940_003977 [Ogataea angusta]KAG7856009.1 hypothetical protein KL919_004402 [Ogataea angusta]
MLLHWVKRPGVRGRPPRTGVGLLQCADAGSSGSVAEKRTGRRRYEDKTAGKSRSRSIDAELPPASTRLWRPPCQVFIKSISLHGNMNNQSPADGHRTTQSVSVGSRTSRSSMDRLRSLGHRLSFSKHSLPNPPPYSNLSSSLKVQQTAEQTVEYDPEDLLESSESDYEEENLKKEEDEKDYCEGGYHPTYVGERYGTEKQYLIVRKLGWGHFSTVWLAFDSKHHRHVAIKIVRSSKNYREAALDEIKILEKIGSGPEAHPGKKHIVRMLDHFVHAGPNGEHICMIFEVLGENMLSLLLRYKQFQKEKTEEYKKTSVSDDENVSSASVEQHIHAINDLTILKESYGGLPLTLVKQIAKQLLLALDYLHRECGIIHTDIKPENVLVEINDVEKLVQILEKDRKDKRLSRLMTSRSHQNSDLGKTDRSRSVSHRPKPIRSSKPLTSPIETRGSVDNFFRSFSFSQRRTGSHDSLPHLKSESAPALNSAPVIPLPTASPAQTAISPQVIPEEEESSEENEEFVDAAELPVPFPEPAVSTPRRTMSLNNDSHQPVSRRESVLSTVSRQSSTATTAVDFDSIISVKIADLGNACWTNLHYTNDIQTRQYRAPEVILGGKWGCSTDLWSLGCLIFELITGDYLFDPKTGSTYNKNDDHLAQIIELLQIWPSKDYLKKCKYSREFFDKSFQSLKNISKLKIWTLHAVLVEKYHIEEPLAYDISKFLLAMLEFEPKRRMDAGSLSNHPWLADCLAEEHVDREFGLRGQDIKGWASEWSG